MKKLFLFILTLFIPFAVYAEELKLDWQTSWGGNSYDLNYELLQTEDGGFLAYGYSDSTDIEGLPNKGSRDAIIIKYDKDGNLMWQTSWGGNDSDEFYYVYQTEDDGFLAFAYSLSTDIEGLPNKGSGDAIIIKYDKDGNLMWQTSWGGNDSDEFYYVYQTEDGGFLASGYSKSTDIEGLPNKGYYDAIIVKYDKDGNLMWQTSWGGNDYDYIRQLLSTEDGGFLAFGSSRTTDIEGLPNKGESDAIIIKYDKDGNLMWQTSWGGNAYDEFDYVYQTKDGSFLASAYSWSTDIEGLPHKGFGDAIIVKYDKDGHLMWQTSWGGNSDDYIKQLLSTKDGSFLASGYSHSSNIEGLPNKGYGDAIIVKYDKNGNLMWQKNWGGNTNEQFDYVYQTEDGSFLAYGYSKSTNIEELPNKGLKDAIIVKYDKDGNMLWQKSWGGNNDDGFDYAYQTEDGGFLVFGYSYSTDIEGLPNKGERDAIIVKYSIEYDLKIITTENGTYTAIQQGKYGIITPTPNDGYEVDNIIIKDKNGNVLDVEITKLEDGTYSFDLYTDVSVEVLFKEKLVNPKTGVNSFIGVMFTMLLIGISGFFMIKNYKNNYEF